MARRRDHHRVDHERGPFRQGLCDRTDDRGVPEHPGLPRSDREVVGDRFHLRPDRVRREHPGSPHLAGVLGRYRRNDRQPKDPERRERLQVRLDARPPSPPESEPATEQAAIICASVIPQVSPGIRLNLCLSCAIPFISSCTDHSYNGCRRDQPPAPRRRHPP